MRKKAPIIVEEYATLKELYLAEKGTLDGYEEMLARLDQQLRDRMARRTQAEGAMSSLPESKPVVEEEVVEYETFKEHYLAEKGTLDGYEETLANVAQQLREQAARGHRIVMKGDRVIRVEHPKPVAQKKPRTKR